jgi:hypothetical protein
LFLLAKENQELAEDIMNEICDSHSMENRGKSFADPKQLEEHLLVEMYRREKRDKIDTMSSKTNRDCYRQEEFFPIAVDWLVSNHNIDRKVFKA